METWDCWGREKGYQRDPCKRVIQASRQEQTVPWAKWVEVKILKTCTFRVSRAEGTRFADWPWDKKRQVKIQNLPLTDFYFPLGSWKIVLYDMESDQIADMRRKEGIKPLTWTIFSVPLIPWWTPASTPAPEAAGCTYKTTSPTPKYILATLCSHWAELPKCTHLMQEERSYLGEFTVQTTSIWSRPVPAFQWFIKRLHLNGLHNKPTLYWVLCLKLGALTSCKFAGAQQGDQPGFWRTSLLSSGLGQGSESSFISKTRMSFLLRPCHRSTVTRSALCCLCGTEIMLSAVIAWLPLWARFCEAVWPK